ncbi:SGNH/GDSL hydrolase family protein [Ferruginibacter sp. SUN106]|uniref:SGNH/GDSL hydrolase family protein n=1 Tax=Ferruginibacter sp. SUN106 TaxID=2978348 RepID=UPI003D364360
MENMRRKLFLVTVCNIFFLLQNFAQGFEVHIDSINKTDKILFVTDHPMIQYTGRIDFSNAELPRMWSPGVYISMKFKGNAITAIIKDQELWGKNHNYLEIIVDEEKKRIQTKSKNNYITISNLSEGSHTLTICKNTESNIGYIEFGGVYCDYLVKPQPKPKRKIEFIGNSITCGASSDMSEIPCGKGVWQDQHNAYLAYGPVTARTLDAQWHLSSVSGIGLIHSCCNMNIIMPPVFDKIDMRGDSVPWNFKKYQPDVVTVCLGQNDGIQDSTTFCKAYIDFVHHLREHYPAAKIVLLTSPMADEKLKAFLKNQINGVLSFLNKEGDKKISKFFFSRSYNGGCDYHPSLEEHQLIAAELTAYLKKLMRW